jgi:hypothetical protein
MDTYYCAEVCNGEGQMGKGKRRKRNGKKNGTELKERSGKWI